MAWPHYSRAVKLRRHWRSRKVRRSAMRCSWALAVIGLMFAVQSRPVDAEGGTGVPVAAVWKEQHLNFFHMGRTSRYSCEGLRDKVRAMLLDLGARRDIRVTALGCQDAGARSRPGSLGP